MPFQPFIEAFDRYLGEQGLDLRGNPIIHFQPHGSSDPQQEHWALFKAAANFIVNSAKESGLVFLVDDLHAADETSLQLFHYLARQTRAAPVALIGTYRIDAPNTSHLSPLLSALYREGLSEAVRLESLNQNAVKQVLENSLQGEVSKDLCQMIYEVTAGNPFFIEEVVRDLLSQDKVKKISEQWSVVSGERLRVPENLSSFLYQKVSRMGSKVQDVLIAAAVIGREFRFEILQEISGLSNDEILDVLDAALSVHLVEEVTDGYRFRHPLIRRTLYENLSKVRRAQLHGRTARAIEAFFGTKQNGLSKQVEALAHHYDLSNRRDLGLPFLIQAGEKAAEVFAFEVALEYFERALMLMDNLGHTDRALRWRLLESLGWWHGSILADTPRAVDCFEQALEVAKDEDQGWSPSSRDIVRVHCGAAVALITAGNIDEADRHLQKALLVMGDKEDAPEYADLLYNLAQLHWHRDEYRLAMEVTQRSLAVAERLKKTDAIARAYEMMALACHSLGEWQEGMAYEQQRADLAGAELDVTDAFDVHL
jgi:tetratricopeptide (TPR) repeat protein